MVSGHCEKAANQAVIYGIGSYISGDTFAAGGIDGEYEVYGENLDMYLGPYIENPRRHIQFSIALLSRSTDPVHEEFDAQCEVSGEDGGDCSGMWYQLPQTKRYLFAGEDVLPIDSILEGDFHSPTPFVQLNAPSFLIDGTPTELEYLNLNNFENTPWNASLGETLGSDSCSSLMESYLSQVEDNNYVLERPLEIMYTSIFFYFMQNAAVTDLSSSSFSSSSSKTISTSSDLLANVQLKGDRQLRRIAMSIPSNSFWISCFSFSDTESERETMSVQSLASADDTKIISSPASFATVATEDNPRRLSLFTCIFDALTVATTTVDKYEEVQLETDPPLTDEKPDPDAEDNNVGAAQHNAEASEPPNATAKEAEYARNNWLELRARVEKVDPRVFAYQNDPKYLQQCEEAKQRRALAAAMSVIPSWH